MHISTSVFVCMLLDRSGAPLAAEIIQANTKDSAADRAAEMLDCAYLPRKAWGYELWHRGRQIATRRVA